MVKASFSTVVGPPRAEPQTRVLSHNRISMSAPEAKCEKRRAPVRRRRKAAIRAVANPSCRASPIAAAPLAPRPSLALKPFAPASTMTIICFPAMTPLRSLHCFRSVTLHLAYNPADTEWHAPRSESTVDISPRKPPRQTLHTRLSVAGGRRVSLSVSQPLRSSPPSPLTSPSRPSPYWLPRSLSRIHP
jgi:hypothetical protein